MWLLSLLCHSVVDLLLCYSEDLTRMLLCCALSLCMFCNHIFVSFSLSFV
uniref:Uncharacterized protein n=1 Tax=Arundo donax TaxID=35708 RepID=A0A0A9DUH0_ARUDO